MYMYACRRLSQKLSTRQKRTDSAELILLKRSQFLKNLNNSYASCAFSCVGIFPRKINLFSPSRLPLVKRIDLNISLKR